VPVDSLISSHRTIHDVDFSVVTKEELQQFEIPMTFLVEKTGALCLLLGCGFVFVGLLCICCFVFL
jgi:hypothetical protein